MSHHYSGPDLGSQGIVGQSERCSSRLHTARLTNPTAAGERRNSLKVGF
jgi:hypothetical protein